MSFVPARRLTLVATTVVLVASGCGGGDPKELRDAATSLAPAGARVLSEEEGHCVDLASSPSCYDLFLQPRPHDQRLRIAAARAAADRAGWQLTEEIQNRRSVRLVFSRGDYVGNVRLVDDSRARACAPQPEPDCSDWIHVLRSG